MRITINPDMSVTIEPYPLIEVKGVSDGEEDNNPVATPGSSCAEIIYSDFPIYRGQDGGWQDSNGHSVRFIAKRTIDDNRSHGWFNYCAKATIESLFKKTPGA